MQHLKLFLVGVTVVALSQVNLLAQPPGGFGRGPGGPGGGPGGPGGPNAPDREIVKDFDKDGDGRLNREERAAARASLKSDGGGRRGGRGPRGPQLEPGKPGEQVAVKDAAVFPDHSLYDSDVVRTIFLTFENDDWEKELADFKPTDVDVPAKMIVDGKEYADVGVSFRGASSFFMIPEGLKRSFNISIDHTDPDQDLYGYRTLNLLNCNGDPSMMSTTLYSWIAGQKIPTPKANFVKVVVNGENWGLYCNVEQFNSDFTDEHFRSKKGARWKVSGSPRGDGGLRYLGEELEPYKERFEIKTKDKESSWRDLIHLCQVLNETDPEDLPEKLDPILDVDGALWFLAVDVALINSDGYWTRASDYSIYQDPSGKFHILPHDMNESFRGARGGPGGGPGGGRGGPGGGPGGFGRRGGPGGGGPGGGGFGPPPGFGPPGDGPGEGRGGPPEGRGGPPEGRGGPPEGRGGERFGGGNQRGGDRGFGGGNQRGGDRGFGGGPPRGPGGDRGGSGNMELDPLVGLEDDSKPLRSKLLANEKLRTRYLQYVRDIAQNWLDWEVVGPRVAETRELLKDEVAKDTRKLFKTEDFIAATAASPQEGSRSIRTFADQRAKYLLNHPAIKDLPAGHIPLALSASVSKPARVGIDELSRADSPLSITEVMAGNTSTIADPQGDYDDWIEIHNSGDDVIDLTGYYLSDDPEHAHKWQFPKGTEIAPKQFLLIWADEDGKDEPGLHANFKLSQKGEQVFVSTADSVVSELKFPEQSADRSYGKLDDGESTLLPTPGKENRGQK